MYQVAVPPMMHSLNNLVAILEKAIAHTEAKKIDPSVLLNSRLYPDMFPLARQVQVTSDFARKGAARLAGLEPPVLEDNETTFAELIDRLKQSIAYLQTLTPEQIDGSEQKTIVFPVGAGKMEFEGLPFLLYFVLPNFYFHVTTAYDILRHCGVEVGKLDFIGKNALGKWVEGQLTPPE